MKPVLTPSTIVPTLKEGEYQLSSSSFWAFIPLVNPTEAFSFVGDELTALLDDLINRIWQVSDKDVSRKRATTTCWLWVSPSFLLFSISFWFIATQSDSGSLSRNLILVHCHAISF